MTETTHVHPPGEPFPAQPARVVIRPASGLASVSLRELWRYREILFFLTWRDLKVRYKQTVFGAAWAVLQPVMTMLVFWFVFGRLVGVPTDGIPYPLFAFAGLVPWFLFSSSLTKSTNSIVNNAHLITKVYFPRLLVPMSAVAGALVDSAIAFVALLGALLFFGYPLGLNALWVIPLSLLAVLIALGSGLVLAALNVRFRDVGHVVPFMMQFWLFLTPVAYPSSLIPVEWRAVYMLNPMTVVVEGYRWALLGQGVSPGVPVVIALGVTGIVLILGLGVFSWMERSFADVV